eukprot:21295-Pelagococcus_subviridis.AAC.1
MGSSLTSAAVAANAAAVAAARRPSLVHPRGQRVPLVLHRLYRGRVMQPVSRLLMPPQRPVPRDEPAARRATHHASPSHLVVFRARGEVHHAAVPRRRARVDEELGARARGDRVRDRGRELARREALLDAVRGRQRD